MKPSERYEWIRKYIAGKHGGVDVLDAEFVNAYIAATNAPHRVTMYGAFKCTQLGRDLSKMHEDYMLKRSRIGIEGMAGMGFPTWVWLYTLHPAWIERAT